MAYAALIAVGLIVLGAGVAQSEAPAKAAELPGQDVAALQRDCAAGKPIFCRLLGDVYRDRAGVPNMARAAAAYELACEGRDAGGCYALASLYMEGAGVAKDPTRAATLFKKSCDAGHGLACTTLGFLYDKGTGVPKDPKRAEALWDQACRQRETTGCVLFEGARRTRERAEGKPSEEVCARHILVKVESSPGTGHSEAEARRRAQAALTSLKAGTDFAKLAQKVSEDTGSASSGGDLGCFARGVMVPEFEDVAFALKVGGTSDVVRTPFGFHVIQRVTKGE
jgi:parvulin-like peptidyl-prolyl isomerase